MANPDTAGPAAARSTPHGAADERSRDKQESCDPSCQPVSGPVREAGGTTGAGNLSPGQASRTGGATSGVSPDHARKPSEERGVPPSA